MLLGIKDAMRKRLVVWLSQKLQNQAEQKNTNQECLFRMNQIAVFFAFEVSQGNGVSNADIIGIVTYRRQTT